MEWLNDLRSFLFDGGSSVFLAPGVVQSLFASLIAAFVSLLIVAPLTARWVKWENEKTLRPLRKSLQSELDTLIIESLRHLEAVSRNIEDDARRINEGSQPLEAYTRRSADSVHIFCENQIARIERFESIFSFVVDGLEPNLRFEVAKLFQEVKLFDVQFCKTQSSSALELMTILGREDLHITTGDFLGFRSLHEAYLFVPTDPHLEQLEKLSTVRVSGLVSSRSADDSDDLKSGFIQFVLCIRDIVPEDWMRDDLIGKRWISTNHNLPSLRKRNNLMHSDK